MANIIDQAAALPAGAQVISGTLHVNNTHMS